MNVPPAVLSCSRRGTGTRAAPLPMSVAAGMATGGVTITGGALRLEFRHLGLQLLHRRLEVAELVGARAARRSQQAGRHEQRDDGVRSEWQFLMDYRLSPRDLCGL